MEQNLPDLNMAGIGSASGGDYRQVRIDGVCRVLTDVVSETFVMNGQVTAQGGVRTKELAGNGKLNVKGTLQAEEARIDGMVSVGGAIAGERLVLNGMLSGESDLEAESFELRGCLDVKGMLNAGSVDIQLYGGCKVREIGGEKIRVAKGSENKWAKLFGWAVPKLIHELKVDVVEGDDIELESTIAGVVRGGRVVIGKGCEIARVEYRDELVVHPQAKVGERIRS